jgi:hypothetical protein
MFATYHGVHPYLSRRSLSTKMKWPSPPCSSSPPPHEAHRDTTRHGAPRHAHHPEAAASTSKQHPQPVLPSTPPAATSNHRRATGAKDGQLANSKLVAPHHAKDTISETIAPPSSMLAGAPPKVGSNTTSSKTDGHDTPPIHPSSRARGLSRHHLGRLKRQ